MRHGAIIRISPVFAAETADIRNPLDARGAADRLTRLPLLRAPFSGISSGILGFECDSCFKDVVATAPGAFF